jgi:hypothetical protein
MNKANIKSGKQLESDKVAASVRQWVESMVVGLNLCPFAKRELVKNRIRFSVTEASTEEQLLQVLESELELINQDRSVETTLLIHPVVLQDFYDFKLFLAYIDNLLVRMNLKGVFQVASFHPDYQFFGTASEDAENYTNRSPYPVLHLIREESLERVIADYPDVDQIPARNIALMNRLGQNKLQTIMWTCLNIDN